MNNTPMQLHLNLPINSGDVRPAEWDEQDTITLSEKGFSLIVWNDDVNTFDWVIQTLIEICGHNPEQAEQCALIIHSAGKYAVKQGSYETLNPMREAICDRQIQATIEEVSN